MQQLTHKPSSATFGALTMERMLWRGVKRMKKGSLQAAIVKATIQGAMKTSE
jgi:hypothetical protein